MKALFYVATLLVAITLIGTLMGWMQGTNTAVSQDNTDPKSIVLLNITTDGQDDPQRLDMAMKLAGFSLDEGRKVAIFFNVKGVRGACLSHLHEAVGGQRGGSGRGR